MSRADRSRLRAQLIQLHRRLGELLEDFDSFHSTLAGVVYELKTRCGKPSCRCRQGELHCAWVVSFSEKGRRRLRTLAPEAIDRVRSMATRYRELRSRRAEINRVFGRLLKAFDRLERSLRVPPSRALAAPRKGEG